MSQIDRLIFNTEGSIARFLVGNDFNVTEAYDQLRAHLRWRKLNNVNQILEDEEVPTREIRKLLPNVWFNADSEGRPLWVISLGKLDLAKVNLSQLMTFVVAELEHTWREKML